VSTVREYCRPGRVNNGTGKFRAEPRAPTSSPTTGLSGKTSNTGPEQTGCKTWVDTALLKGVAQPSKGTTDETGTANGLERAGHPARDEAAPLKGVEQPTGRTAGRGGPKTGAGCSDVGRDIARSVTGARKADEDSGSEKDEE
jgi:hypothetical protein